MSDDMFVKHHFADNLYAKESFIPKGFRCAKHVHLYSHLSILSKGRVIVIADGVEFNYDATDRPACIKIEAGVLHEVIALDDSIWFCIHQTDEKDETKIDKVLIERGA